MAAPLTVDDRHHSAATKVAVPGRILILDIVRAGDIIARRGLKAYPTLGEGWQIEREPGWARQVIPA
ncbi:MAG TPA: hypothetical protein VH702_07870 [Vicinamibacterales bacterium]